MMMIKQIYLFIYLFCSHQMTIDKCSNLPKLNKDPNQEFYFILFAFSTSSKMENSKLWYL